MMTSNVQPTPILGSTKPNKAGLRLNSFKIGIKWRVFKNIQRFPLGIMT